MEKLFVIGASNPDVEDLLKSCRLQGLSGE